MVNKNDRLNEFITFLKDFEKEILKMPWKYVDTGKADIYPKLDHIFKNYIDIENTTKPQMNAIMKIIGDHGIHTTVKSLIMAVWICRLDEMETYNSYSVRTGLVEDHLFKIVR